MKKCTEYFRRKHYHFVNFTIAYHKTRWIFTLALALWYLYRAVGLSYDLITYLIAFYILQLLIEYFTPQGLQQADAMEYSSYYSFEELSPQYSYSPLQLEEQLSEEQQSQQFQLPQPSKPLVSSMNQHQIWIRISLAFKLGIICTLFKEMKVDVFWPMLMVYFILLICYTIINIVKKMRKYRYSISDFKKKTIVV